MHPRQLLYSSLLVAMSPAAAGSWPTSSTENQPVCLSRNGQSGVMLAPDGDHGAILAWTDGWNLNDDVFAQRVLGDGLPVWQTWGISIRGTPTRDDFDGIVSDAAGGAILIWRTDFSTLYAQRVNGSGTSLWATNGVVVCTTTWNSSTRPRLIEDAAGGAIVVWEDVRSGALDIYGQHLDADGNALWSAGGAAVAAATNNQSDASIVADGAGGALVAWRDARNGSNGDIYAQHLDGL